MKGLVAILFGVVVLIAVITGMVFIFSLSESRPLPADTIYTFTNSSVNQSTKLIMGFAPAGISIMVPFILILLVFFIVGVLFFVFGKQRGR